MGLYRFLFRISKPIHKYTGLILCLYFLAMGASGLLLNNPDLIRSAGVPWSLTPDNYEPKNWNRMYLREGAIKGNQWFLAGKPGVMYSADGGESFRMLTEGFPSSVYGRDTNSLLVEGENHEITLYAATRSGLHYRNLDQPWHKVNLDTNHSTIVDIVKTPQSIIAFGEKEAFIAQEGNDKFVAKKPAIAHSTNQPPVPLFRVLHDIHNGKILGAAGKYLIDILSLGLIFLTLSALIIWYVPWRNRRMASWFKRPGTIFRFSWKYHLKVGIFSVAFLMILAITGALLRPPLLIAIAPYSIDTDNPLLTLSDRSDGLGGKIRKATYASHDNSLILATDGGFFRGPADLSAPLQPWHNPVPIHGMGVTVLEEIEPGAYLIGSFMGLYIWNENMGQLWRLPRPGLQGDNPYRSNDLVSAVVMEESMPRYRVDYHDGMMPVFARGTATPPAMPAEIVEHTPLSLWHYLFEFHNGRIFEKWLGSSYMLIVPVAGILLILLGLTGCIDWLFRKIRRAKAR